MPDRPNLLYIMTDQQAGSALSCAGNPQLRTPALDRLASRGIRFPNAYTSYPLCVPARMSMMTSRMPHELGIYVNTPIADEPCAAPLFPPAIRDAGYETHYIGKWHLTIAQDKTDEHGFDTIEFGGGYGDLDSKKAAAAVDFLERPHDRPFFLVVSFNNPHDACELARGQKLRMGDLPPLPPDDELPPLPHNHAIPNDEPPVLAEFRRTQPQSVGRASRWEDLDTRRFRWGYCRLVEMVDAEIGRVLDALDRQGLWDDTLIVFTSDHGDGQGTHRWNQKWSFYDESCRIPCLVAAPDQAGTGRIDQRLVSPMLDLGPTLCDYAGVDHPAGALGRSLRPLIEDTNDTVAAWRHFLASEVSFGNWAPLHEDSWPKARMIRSDRYKYCAYEGDQGPREQLFDLATDPGEMHNLALAPDSAATLAHHRTMLAAWLTRTDDSFVPPSQPGPSR